jgi:mRNA interferase MazF
MPSATCNQWDVVVVPFPFTDRPQAKRRPALVLSKRTFNLNGHTVLAMITSSAHEPWLGDIPITRLDAAGLKTSCMVRLKLFTLDNRLILKVIGHLAESDSGRVADELSAHLT